MLIQIGSTKDPTDVVDLLMECHERIRSFSARTASRQSNSNFVDTGVQVVMHSAPQKGVLRL